MKITMLGTSGSGKTTYLSAMLGVFYESAIDGFNVRPFNNTSDAAVVREIELINTLYRSGEFPMATADTIRTLSLSLYKYSNKLVDFDFIDYRGGALDEIARDEKAKEVNMLSTAILASDVVLVFVDAIILKECKNDVVARRQLGVLPITTVILRARDDAKESQKKINVVFVLTKVDASTIDPEEIPGLKNRVKDIYANIYAQFGDESRGFKILETAAVGSGKVKTVAKWKNANVEARNTITTETLDYEPVNIATVLAQAFLSGIENVSYDVKKLAAVLEEKKSNFGYLRQMVDFLFNRSRQRREIQSLEIELQESQEQLKALQRYKKDLQRIISSKR